MPRQLSFGVGKISKGGSVGEAVMRINSNEEKQLNELIRGSYNDFVRLERRNILLASSVTLVSAFSGVNPSGLSVLGFTFNNLTQFTFYSTLVLFIGYFLVAFLIYSIPNYRDAKLARQKILNDAATVEYIRPWYSIVPPNIDTDARYYSWVFIHFLFPVIFGVGAIAVSAVKIA
jgi:hypothetical protein